MKTDKDRPSTWIKYKPELCQKCMGSCCTMPVEIEASDLLQMGLITEDEYQTSHKKAFKRLLKSGIVSQFRSTTGKFMLAQKANDDCYFLDSKTRLCTVYSKRPQVCRDFPTKMGPKLTYCPFLAKV